MTAGTIHVVGGFTIDAVLHADGKFTTEQPGGNALWAALGVCALGGGRAAAHSVIGSDYPGPAVAAIAARGVDVSSVRRNRDGRNARITFQYRPDGTRTQPAPPAAVSQLPDDVQARFGDTTHDAAATLASLPTAAELAESPDVRGGIWHVGLLPIARFASITAMLRSRHAGFLQADCPARSELARTGLASLRDHLAELDAFLPSTSDTDVFAPGVPHPELIARFHAWGAPIVVLKRGDQGAIVSVAQGPGRGQWHVPAFPVPGFVDATGAGDVFCGLFAYFVSGGMTAVEAAVEACAGASYATEVASPLELAAPGPEDFAARRRRVLSGVRAL